MHLPATVYAGAESSKFRVQKCAGSAGVSPARFSAAATTSPARRRRFQGRVKVRIADGHIGTIDNSLAARQSFPMKTFSLLAILLVMHTIAVRAGSLHEIAVKDIDGKDTTLK